MPVNFHNNNTEIGAKTKTLKSSIHKGFPKEFLMQQGLPFSWGPRTCMGQHFVMIEVKVELSFGMFNCR